MLVKLCQNINILCPKSKTLICAGSFKHLVILQQRFSAAKADPLSKMNIKPKSPPSSFGKPILIYENKSVRFFSAMAWSALGFLCFWTVNANIAVWFV